MALHVPERRGPVPAGPRPESIVAGDMLWEEFVHPDDLHMLGEDIDRDLAAGSPTTESEYRILAASGEPRWVLDRAMFVRNEEGEPVG